MLKHPELEGRFVRLEPLSEVHAEGLQQCISAEEWRYIPIEFPQKLDDWLAFIHVAQADVSRGWALPYAVYCKQRQTVVGTTRMLDINLGHKGLEIGYTLYATDVHGSMVNPECKLLLMEYAFEVLGMMRVFLKTDERNRHSQRAIEKLGAQKEGVLRNHMLCADGHRRNSVYYSVLDEEWSGVKNGLVARLYSAKGAASAR